MIRETVRTNNEAEDLSIYLSIYEIDKKMLRNLNLRCYLMSLHKTTQFITIHHKCNVYDDNVASKQENLGKSIQSKNDVISYYQFIAPGTDRQVISARVRPHLRA